MNAVIIAIFAVVLVAAVIIAYLVGGTIQKKDFEAKVGNAEEKARQIIDDALKEAEEKKR